MAETEKEINMELACPQCAMYYGTAGKSNHQCQAPGVKADTFFSPEQNAFNQSAKEATAWVQEEIRKAYTLGFKEGVASTKLTP